MSRYCDLSLRSCFQLLVLLTLLAHAHATLPTGSQESDTFDNCGSNASWHVTIPSWEAANTDLKLASWWQDVSSRPHESFAKELGRGFGGHINAFECGIGAFSSCTVTGCSVYEDKHDPVWSYLALQSVVNLNQFFNSLHNGITTGQIGFASLSNDMANNFFSWKDPTFILGDLVSWIVAVMTILFAIPAALGAGPAGVYAAVAIGAFVGGGTQHFIGSKEPGVIDASMTKSEGLTAISSSTGVFATASRDSIETWATTTMQGKNDSSGKSILDYLQDGAFVFVQDKLPSNTQIEQYYQKQMISRTINAQWKKDKVFVTFFKTDDQDDTAGPNATRYYADGGVYYLYRYVEDSILRGYLDKPSGLDRLNATEYGISGQDISKASAGAFRAAGFNYTQDIAKERITASMSSNGTISPFKDGVGWEGTWDLPVCDMRRNNWNTQYGSRKTRYGKLPCCCGPNCIDTKAFVLAANLTNFQTLLRGCKEQLKDHPTIEFESIDYGFGWKRNFPLMWAAFSTGQKAGVAVGMIIGGILLGCFCVWTLVCCCCC